GHEPGRVVMRISVGYADAPVPRARDERGHPAIVGPHPWIARALSAYCDAGADGFAINFMGDRSRLLHAIRSFAEGVMPHVNATADEATPAAGRPGTGVGQRS